MNLWESTRGEAANAVETSPQYHEALMLCRAYSSSAELSNILNTLEIVAENSYNGIKATVASESFFPKNETVDFVAVYTVSLAIETYKTARAIGDPQYARDSIIKSSVGDSDPEFTKLLEFIDKKIESLRDNAQDPHTAALILKLQEKCQEVIADQAEYRGELLQLAR